MRSRPVQFKKTVLNSLLLAAFSTSLAGSPLAYAYSVEPVYSPEGIHYINFCLAEVGLKYDNFDFFGYTPADRTLSQNEIIGMKMGLNYFWKVLKDDYRAKAPINILIIPYSVRDDNASALSLRLEGSQLTELGALWTGDESTNPYAAYISIDLPWYEEDWYIDNLPVLPNVGTGSDLPGTMLHELFHAFGLNNVAVREDGQFQIWPQYHTAYNDFLYDAYDRNLGTLADAVGENPIFITPVDPDTDITSWEPNRFYVRYENQLSGIYFSGPMVDDVLNAATIAWPTDLYEEERELPEAVPGLPINGYEAIGYEGYEPYYDGSHIELQNSLMSHQMYRNWCVLMEAELALLQDIGYNIDRKRFFGFSIYNDGKTITNTNGYWARNESGTDWLSGVPSTQDWGVGLHVYGSGNTITQKADLLADGQWGIGARIDGSDNNLTIASDVRIQANGYGGKGILFSWGKEQNLTIESGAQVEATGENGIAVSFDFGSNELGDYYGYFGSYTALYEFKPLESIPEVLQGALVNEFRLKGDIKGSFASIYISPNAYVRQIVVEPGARIEGDIISLWNPERTLYGAEHSGVPEDESLITLLVFGTDEEITTFSSATDTIEFSDQIWGPESLAMIVNNTTMDFSGQAAVVNVTVAPNSTLKGGTYYITASDDPDLSYPAEFLNGGSLISTQNSPVTIYGDYVQQDANLTLSVQDGRFVPLKVSGEATLRGSSSITATLEGGWQREGVVKVDLDSPVINAATVYQGDLTYSLTPASDLPSSPSLIIEDLDGDDGWIVSRKPQAYSRYVSGEAKEIAEIFDKSAAALSDDTVKDFFAKLDWSDTQGLGIAEAAQALYGDGVMDGIGAMLGLERLAHRVLSHPHYLAQPDGEYAWITPFGASATARTISNARMKVAGLAGGWVNKEADRETGLTVATMDSDGKSAKASELDAKGLWLSGFWRQNRISSSIAFAETAASIGYTNSDGKRLVTYLGYTDSVKSDADYWSVGLSAKTGLNIQASETSMIEPFVGLAGTMLYSSSYKERSNGVSALALDSSLYRSLEAQIGVRIQGAIQEDNKAHWEIYSQYGRELLSNAGEMKASFVRRDLRGSFDRTVHWDSKDRVQAGIKVGIENRTGLSINARVDADWTTSDTHSVAGGVEILWKF